MRVGVAGRSSGSRPSGPAAGSKKFCFNRAYHACMRIFTHTYTYIYTHAHIFFQTASTPAGFEIEMYTLPCSRLRVRGVGGAQVAHFARKVTAQTPKGDPSATPGAPPGLHALWPAHDIRAGVRASYGRTISALAATGASSAAPGLSHGDLLGATQAGAGTPPSWIPLPWKAVFFITDWDGADCGGHWPLAFLPCASAEKVLPTRIPPPRGKAAAALPPSAHAARPHPPRIAAANVSSACLRRPARPSPAWSPDLLHNLSLQQVLPLNFAL